MERRRPVGGAVAGPWRGRIVPSPPPMRQLRGGRAVHRFEIGGRPFRARRGHSSTLSRVAPISMSQALLCHGYKPMRFVDQSFGRRLGSGNRALQQSVDMFPEHIIAPIVVRLACHEKIRVLEEVWMTSLTKELVSGKYARDWLFNATYKL